MPKPNLNYKPYNSTSANKYKAVNWIDSEGRFTRGKYGPENNVSNKGCYVTDVIKYDRQYVEWLMWNVDMLNEDFNLIKIMLSRAG